MLEIFIFNILYSFQIYLQYKVKILKICVEFENIGSIWRVLQTNLKLIVGKFWDLKIVTRVLRRKPLKTHLGAPPIMKLRTKQL